MEQSSTPTPVQSKRSTPWGTIIGIVLILAIVVAGAYYSFMKRYQPSHQATTTQQS